MDDARVDADGGGQAAITPRAREAPPHAAFLKEDGAPAVAAFDAAVEFAPLIHPAYGIGGLLSLLQVGQVFGEYDFAQQSEYAIQGSTIGRACDDDAVVSVDAVVRQPIAILAK